MMKLNKPVVLVGMPGSGKSHVGGLLAARLNAPFFDADALIEKEIGCSIASFFAEKGEADFRHIEKRIIAQQIHHGGLQVLSTGGGAVLDAETRALFKARTVSVWLQADAAVLFERVKEDEGRPLLQGDAQQRIAALLAARRGLYAESLMQVDSNVPPEKTVELIYAKLQEL